MEFNNMLTILTKLCSLSLSPPISENQIPMGLEYSARLGKAALNLFCHAGIIPGASL